MVGGSDWKVYDWRVSGFQDQARVKKTSSEIPCNYSSKLMKNYQPPSASTSSLCEILVEHLAQGAFKHTHLKIASA